MTEKREARDAQKHNISQEELSAVYEVDVDDTTTPERLSRYCRSDLAKHAAIHLPGFKTLARDVKKQVRTTFSAHDKDGSCCVHLRSVDLSTMLVK